MRKLLRDQKVNDGKSTYPQASSGEFILAERCACTPGRILRYTKYGLRTRQIKMLGQRSKCPIKLIQITTEARLSLGPPVRLSTLYCTLFFPNKHMSQYFLKETYTAQNSLELKLPSRSSPPFYAKQRTLSPEGKNGH